MRERKKRNREREICRICPELLFLFLKGMTGALAPFSYLIFYSKVKRDKMIVLTKPSHDHCFGRDA